MAYDQERRVTRAHHSRASTCGIKRDTHRRHKGACAKNTAEIIVHCFHYRRWSVVFHAAMMEKKFCQSGKQRSSGPVAGAICNPKQNPAVFHGQPTVDVTAYLDYGTIARGNLPTGQHRRLLRDQWLLRQAGGGQIALKIATPFFELIVLPL